MTWQSLHRAFSLSVKNGRSLLSYRAVLVSGSRRAIFLPPVLLVPVLPLPLPPQAASTVITPTASAPSAFIFHVMGMSPLTYWYVASLGPSQQANPRPLPVCATDLRKFGRGHPRPLWGAPPVTGGR